MLFNSLPFLLLFLPASLILSGLASLATARLRMAALLLVSLVFYALWDLRFLPLLAASIVLNWLLAGLFVRTKVPGLVTIAVALNLALLGVFKYLGFFADLVDALPGITIPHLDLAFPVGISFFTFQHIMYLADLRSGHAKPTGLLDYALYVAFFPRVIAGPLVRPGEFLPQVEQPGAISAETFARGLMLLTFGLAKKVFLGDPLGTYANPVFADAAAGHIPSLAAAWQGVLGYTFQLYFDFSGYTDMALGLALLCGITLPQNFNAPYRSTSIQDFWRRWHITLGAFLRDYLYFPMGGSRHGLPRQVLALFATMALGGLWHGAGLTFVIWGAAHGIALGLHVLWSKAGLKMPAALGIACTFAFVALSWVVFRAPTFAAALAMYEGLVGLGPAGTPQLTSPVWPLLAVAAALATIGPTAWTLAHKLPPARLAAAVVTLVFVAILLKVGDDTNYDFIYAQF